MVGSSLDCVLKNSNTENFFENNEKIENSFSERIARETNYVNKRADIERFFLNEYNGLKSDRKRAKYIKNLVKNKDYFSAYKLYTSKLYTGQDIKDKEMVKVWADKVVEILIENQVPGLIPIYATIMYIVGGVKKINIIKRITPKFEAKNISKEEMNEILNWHPIYRY
jgi:hypothetical protein